MASAQRFDHVGITVNDLDAAVAFFTALGLESEGEARVEGHFVSTVVGMTDVRTRVVMLTLPGATTKLELSTFERSDQQRPVPAPLPANEPGLRNVCFEVDDLQTVVDRVRADGHELVGGIAEWEDTYRMCYVRGPEGIIVSLAQFIG
jgi:catechol 2,3-dioxygenase-like lactoylglutathione lyase family enzyme